MTAFTDCELESFVRLAETLRGIHARLAAEGYTVENGRFIVPKRPKRG